MLSEYGQRKEDKIFRIIIRSYRAYIISKQGYISDYTYFSCIYNRYLGRYTVIQMQNALWFNCLSLIYSIEINSVRINLLLSQMSSYTNVTPKRYKSKEGGSVKTWSVWNVKPQKRSTHKADVYHVCKNINAVFIPCTRVVPKVRRHPLFSPYI